MVDKDIAAKTEVPVATEGEAPGVAQAKPGIGAVLAQWGGAAFLATGTVFALSYLAQCAFYGAFGLTPDQIGLDKVASVLRATPLALLLLLCALSSSIVLVGLVRFVTDSFGDVIRGRVGLVLVAVPLILLLVLVVANATHFLTMSAGLVNGAVSVLLCWAFVAGVGVVIARVGGRALGVLAATMTLLCAAGVQGSVWISDGAVAFRDHGVVSARLGLIGFAPTVAAVSWRDPKHVPAQQVVIVLNQSGDRFTLYDCLNQRVLSLGSADAEVQRLLPAQAGQGWLHNATGCY
ncbi:hypothetical protein [Amycolatopsis sp. SID8362]|uniref:hypothetical protein n=1 Tax=Amycolatopsis sp. SID8362 TaxID=2690346 RepID=UPI001368F16D|nr:hypothetical protein [Amycolatopsis sp. SID8362]NBH11002.1 hypothetical protein [Amycolatopsis sp. SID8362]NED47693.1 hypothetical protein [Amycolatopsis sp. SID8362]